jgi:phosphatidylserine decarboxylase
MELLRFLPLSWISWCIGLLANMPLPQPLARWTIQIFARIYGIDPMLATRPLNDFRSIGDFFVRDLDPRHRPIQGDWIFPVDGTLRHLCQVESGGSLTQVKGKRYSLQELLGNDVFTERFINGQLWNMYLSPKDAHHIYAPASGRIVKTVHIPGALWPVNDWALNSIDALFAVNERVVTFIETNKGLIAVVMVGATNVGSISLAYMDLVTNRRPWWRLPQATFEHSKSIQVQRGEKIGTFRMGSSVLLVTENTLAPALESQREARSIRYGELLLSDAITAERPR